MEHEQQKRAWVYMVRCKNGSLYTGWTDDLQKRLEAHQKGSGAKYTRGFGAEGFAYTEELNGRSEAMRREAAIKKLPKARKEALCAGWQAARRAVLRPVRLEDTEALLEIYGWYVKNALATLAWTVPTLEEYRRWVEESRRNYPFLVAENAEGKVVGFACAHRYHPRESFDWSAETTIYLSPEARGSMLGAPLYQALLALLHMQGCWRAYAVLADPNPGSEAFHKKMGFYCACRLPRSAWKLGQWCGISTWTMELRTGEDAPEPLGPVPPLAVQEQVLRQVKEGRSWQQIVRDGCPD